MCLLGAKRVGEICPNRRVRQDQTNPPTTEDSLLIPACMKAESGARNTCVFSWAYFFMLYKLVLRIFHSTEWCPSILPHCARMLLSSTQPWRSVPLTLKFTHILPLAALIAITETLSDKQSPKKNFFDNFSL